MARASGPEYAKAMPPPNYDWNPSLVGRRAQPRVRLLRPPFRYSRGVLPITRTVRTGTVCGYSEGRERPGCCRSAAGGYCCGDGATICIRNMP